MKQCVGLGVIADNLVNLGRWLVAQPAQEVGRPERNEQLKLSSQCQGIADKFASLPCCSAARRMTSSRSRGTARFT